MKDCCAPNCYSSIRDGSLFRFPRDEPRCSQWLKNVGNPTYKSYSAEQCYSHLRLCGLHFEERCFPNSKKNRLRRNSIPTLFTEEDHLRIVSLKVIPSMESFYTEKMNYEPQILGHTVPDQAHANNIYSITEELSADIGLEIEVRSENPTSENQSLSDVCLNCETAMERLAKELILLDMPSSTWGVHVHPKYEFIGILHVKITDTELIVDKGIVLVEEKNKLRVKILLNGFFAYLPDILLSVPLISDLSALLYNLHNKPVCMNSVDSVQHPSCLKLIDDGEDAGEKYCKACRCVAVTADADEPKVEAEEVNLTQPSCKFDKIQSDIDENRSEQCKPICDVCDKDVPEGDLILHKQNHNEPTESKKASSNKLDKKNESRKKKYSKGNQGLCNICGKTFSTGCRVEEHLLTHALEKPFQCKVCNRSFAKSFNLKMHEYTHSGERPYVCSFCGKSYRTSSNLRTHTISCHSEDERKRYICELCGKTFIYPRYLKLHMRMHTGERPYKCTFCGKKFSKNVHLTAHMRTHTGEKPYKCIACHKIFATTGGLHYHNKVHHKMSTSI